MSGILHNVALRRSLHDAVDGRDSAVKTVTHAYKALNDADSLMREHGITGGLHFDSRGRDSLERAIANIDRSFWRAAFDMTGLHRVMDAQARREFSDSLERKPPPFTMGNIQSTFLVMSQEADKIFNRGVYNLFRRLSDRYETNKMEPFKVSRRCIITYAFTHWSGRPSINNSFSPQLSDLDRIISVFQDKPHIARSLESEINGQLVDGNTIYESETLRFKSFKNGNGHLLIKDEALLERINQAIIDFCGDNALASDKPSYRWA